MTAFDHEIDGVLIGHAFQPPMSDSERVRNLVSGFDVILIFGNGVKCAKVANMSVDQPFEHPLRCSSIDYGERCPVAKSGSCEAFRFVQVEPALIEIYQRSFASLCLSVLPGRNDACVMQDYAAQKGQRGKKLERSHDSSFIPRFPDGLARLHRRAVLRSIR